LVFSSLVFLFLFLPLVLTVYLVLPVRGRNFFLLVASLFFYSWGEGFFVAAMLGSILYNYLIGLLIDRSLSDYSRRLWLALGVAGNLALLGFYKYSNFIAENLNDLRAHAGMAPFEWTAIPLPIGISFFTFQAMSYVIDVFRRESAVQKNPFNLALYIALFPQLIAGPIVRYHDIARQLVSRSVRVPLFVEGIRRFILGLGKKVIIANTVGRTADEIFGLSSGDLTCSLAWLGIACYTLQIYFDFSGYSDMAIGLGKMFGFRFVENFRYPYISQSIREFWRRWHISLSTWFRDYLYIPLGGNRYSSLRTGFNLLLVFFLCGLWHGASWTFVIWGLFHGFFLALERGFLERLLLKLPSVLRHGYTLLVVMVGWVFFRAETFEQALAYLGTMAGVHAGDPVQHPFALYMNRELLLVLLLGALGSTPIFPWAGKLVRSSLGFYPGNPLPRKRALAWVGDGILMFSVLLYSAMLLASQTHNPFLYFRF
jgi:alginate O-acetyltransferase complex protein AlgI